MAYIDLNPIHAGIAQTPESSDFTSGQDRIRATISKSQLTAMRQSFQEKQAQAKKTESLDNYHKNLEIQSRLDQWLSPIQAVAKDQPHTGFGFFLNMDLDEYLQILDWTGRQKRLDKPGSIPENLAPILDRMEIEAGQWLDLVQSFDSLFHRVAGRLKAIKKHTEVLGKKWLAGSSTAKEVFR